MASMHHPKEGAIRVLVFSGIEAVASGLQRFGDIRQTAVRVVGRTGVLQDALELVDRFAPEVILVDLDGVEGLNALRKMRTHTDARLLALTGSDHAEQRDSAMRAGASGVLLTGEPLETLIQAIRVVHEGELWIPGCTADRLLAARFRYSDSFESDFASQRRLATLTRRERRVAIEITRNASATIGQIAASLRISETTLRDHLASIYRKLECSKGASCDLVLGCDLAAAARDGQGRRGHDPIVLEPARSLAGIIQLRTRRRSGRDRE